MPEDFSLARPRLTPRGSATRERILTAAADLVFSSGAAAMSLDDVMASSGTSKSQIYRHFATRDHLLRAVVSYQGERIVRGQQPQLSELNTIVGLRRWRDRVIELQDATDYAGGCPLGSLANELAVDDATRPALERSFDEWEAYLVAGLGRMRQRGHLPLKSDPRALAEALMAALQGGLLLTKTRRTSRPLANALNAVIDHIEDLARQTPTKQIRNLGRQDSVTCAPP